MGLYLDTSVMIAVQEDEPTRALFGKMLLDQGQLLLISDFAHAEASGALMAIWRAGNRLPALIEQELSRLDEWTAELAEPVQIAPEDIANATAFVRYKDVVLRAPDAIHLAAARRLDVTILTLDRGMSRAASLLGVPCINPVDDPADRKF